ncbi:Protein TOXD [Lachnellula hyalina]|uniref:Protein TOXD n=1 Tax=Lachnellula hyalina TaxID=1316788 RepID=A0A8H8TVU7_9HELO|nr:Protein TOXD [Lachnellula hyalina]TVY24189.1 Protein TOXD [Lachnellula hyalina]
MSSNKAIIVQKLGLAQVVDAPLPKLRDNYILIEVRAIALNPADWKHIDYLSLPGNWCGLDYAGVVLEVGSAVTKPFKKGDRICGACHGGNTLYLEDGSFAKYITAIGDCQIHIPSNLSFEQASTLGVGMITISQALYKWLQLPLPPAIVSPSFPVLIYGGASATGVLAIQYAKLSGCKPIIATASPSNFEFLKELGADYVFDYHNAEACVQEIREVAGDSLTRVLDCIGVEIICFPAMSTSIDGVYCTVSDRPPGEITNNKIRRERVEGYTACGEPFEMMGHRIEINVHDYELGKAFNEINKKLVEDGKIKTHKISINEGGIGLEGALVGMQLMREGKVSGRKLVYTID